MFRLRSYHARLWLVVALGIFVASGAVHALIVEATVLPLGGGVFHYDFSITNDEAEDVSIVSIVDAPLADPLIDPSLATPAGFLGSYDGGLGFVDFFEDTELFGVGTTKGPFSFNSMSGPAPGVFSAFEALSIFGTLYSGDVDVTIVAPVIPEPGTVVLLAVGVSVFGLIAVRRKRQLLS